MHRLLLTTLALGLTACAGASTFDTGRTIVNGPRTSFAELAGGRDLTTIVVGNPFAIDDEAFGRSVAGILNDRNSRAPTNFTTTPGPSARIGDAIVLVFNATGGVRASDLCRDPRTIETAPGTAPISMQMVFCANGSAISGRKGRLPGATGPDDPAFQQFLGLGLSLSQPSGVFRIGDTATD